LNADIFKKTRESETITSLVTMPGELKKKEKEIADLRKHYENALREEQEKNKYLDDAYREMEKRHDELERQLENLQTVPKSVLEVQKPPIPQPQKTDTNNVTPPIQRITEREKTEKERIIETIATNPFTNREIQCPLKKQQYQDIMKECNKACSALAECPYWPDISRGTVPLGAKIRDKQEV
jgi:predicted nuclease with TOPRIM domain